MAVIAINNKIMSYLYTPNYFRNNFPEWKRKKDPLLTRFLYRPLSFVTASICAKNEINANTVSYASFLIAIIACLLFLFPQEGWHIFAAILINIWLLMDCTDGNLARTYRKQPFGEFADGISSYILVGLMCTTIAFSVYFSGGVFVKPGNPWIILIGAFASSSDTMMRLIYQKYKATEREMADRGVLDIELDKRTDHSLVGSLRVRVEAELGIGGLLPFAILLATIFNALDLIVIYCFLYYGFSCLIASYMYIRKAMKATMLYQDRMPQS